MKKLKNISNPENANDCLLARESRDLAESTVGLNGGSRQPESDKLRSSLSEWKVRTDICGQRKHRKRKTHEKNSLTVTGF